MAWAWRACVLALALPVLPIAAQARPSGAHRPWLELGLGAGREHQNCTGCGSPQISGGVIFTLAGGTTITPSLGVGVEGRAFEEFNLENKGQSSRDLLVVGQYTPPIPGRFTTFDLGAGGGWHFGHGSRTENSGQGAIVSIGFALRVPSPTNVALALTADRIQNITGRTATSGGGSTSYRPTLFSVGLGLSLAGEPGT